MGLGVLDDKVMAHVPGTTRYFDDPERPQYARDGITHLKCDGEIILVPQPSDDPNDPLNWPLWKRDLVLAALILPCVFTAALNSILAANTLSLSVYYSKPFSKVAILTGWMLLGVGAAGIFIVPTARVYGKRHLYIAGTILAFVGSLWGGLTEHYVHGFTDFDGKNTAFRNMIGARILQGAGAAPFEALINASVGDMYFVHQRGARMAITNMAIFGSSFFTPIIVGKVTYTLGWPWSFYLEAIFIGLCIPLMVFFCPETAFRRPQQFETDLAGDSTDSVQQISGSQKQQTSTSSDHDSGHEYTEKSALENSAVKTPHTVAPANAQPYINPDIPRRSYLQSLAPINGTFLDEPWWHLLLRPFPLFFQPAIFWACIIQGCMIGWTVFIGVILGAVFIGPPLFWNEVNTGYAYTGPFLGAIFGFLFAGAIADPLAKWMTRRNGGIYEPEFRLWLVVPQLVFGVAGLYGFGVTSADLLNYTWVLPVVFFGFVTAGMVIGAIAASLYIVDAHRDIAVEAFTCQLIFKNFFSFGLTFSAIDWMLGSGPYKVFMWVASITIFICLSTIPMYVFGKRNRSFFHRHDILKTLKLR